MLFINENRNDAESFVVYSGSKNTWDMQSWILQSSIPSLQFFFKTFFK